MWDFDYVIVGAGGAGLPVMAGRLSGTRTTRYSCREYRPAP